MAWYPCLASFGNDIPLPDGILQPVIRGQGTREESGGKINSAHS